MSNHQFNMNTVHLFPTYLQIHYRSPTDSTKEEYKTISEKLDKVNLDDSSASKSEEELDVSHRAPEGVADFDRENWNDVFQVSQYAMDIFHYLKNREVSITLFERAWFKICFNLIVS